MFESISKRRPRLYIAAPLFSRAELSFNGCIKNMLSPYFDIYLPQEDGDLLTDCVKHGDLLEQASKKIFLSDIKALENCNILLIILDGRSIDEGAAFELGYAFALGKECIGLQTDTRRLLPLGNNPMIANALEIILGSVEELISWAISRHTTNGLEIPDSITAEETGCLPKGEIPELQVPLCRGIGDEVSHRARDFAGTGREDML